MRGVVDLDGDDGPVAGDSVRPERLGPGAVAAQRLAGRAQGRVEIVDMRGEALKQARLIGGEAEVVELYARARPGERRRPVEGRRLATLVGDAQYVGAGVGDRRPEGDA